MSQIDYLYFTSWIRKHKTKIFQFTSNTIVWSSYFHTVSEVLFEYLYHKTSLSGEDLQWIVGQSDKPNGTRYNEPCCARFNKACRNLFPSPKSWCGCKYKGCSSQWVCTPRHSRASNMFKVDKVGGSLLANTSKASGRQLPYHTLPPPLQSYWDGARREGWAKTQVAPAGQAIRVMVWLGLESWSDKHHWARE